VCPYIPSASLYPAAIAVGRLCFGLGPRAVISFDRPGLARSENAWFSSKIKMKWLVRLWMICCIFAQSWSIDCSDLLIHMEWKISFHQFFLNHKNKKICQFLYFQCFMYRQITCQQDNAFSDLRWSCEWRTHIFILFQAPLPTSNGLIFMEKML
jgi:hypothetical protein